MFGALDISASGLRAQRTNLDVIAGNITNMFTTRGVNGEPFRRRIAVFAEGNPAMGKEGAGVHIQQIARDPSPFRMEFDPSHADAMQSGPHKGYVRYPNVDLSTEMVNAMAATRAYEANVTVMEITKSMGAAALRLIA